MLNQAGITLGCDSCFPEFVSYCQCQTLLHWDQIHTHSSPPISIHTIRCLQLSLQVLLIMSLGWGCTAAATCTPPPPLALCQYFVIKINAFPPVRSDSMLGWNVWCFLRSQSFCTDALVYYYNTRVVVILIILFHFCKFSSSRIKFKLI